MSVVLTRWYPARITPVRKGVYEVKCARSGTGWYAYWDGERFGWRSLSVDGAFYDRHTITYLSPKATWRGLARKP